MDMHVNFVLSQCSQRLYLLKWRRCQCLSTAQLDQVSQVLTVSRLRHALPAWSGFLTANLIDRIVYTTVYSQTAQQVWLYCSANILQ